MDSEVEALMADLVEWVAREPRTYRDVMDVWKTFCPRLTIWEDTIDRGYLLRQFEPSFGATVVVTQAGQKFLQAQGRTVVAQAPAVADA